MAPVCLRWTSPIGKSGCRSGNVSVSPRVIHERCCFQNSIPKTISADDPDALGARRDTTTLATPGAASQRDPDVSPQNGPPANDGTKLEERRYGWHPDSTKWTVNETRQEKTKTESETESKTESKTESETINKK
jgi:hypothetical protein